MIHCRDHLLSGGKMMLRRKHTKRFVLIPMILALLAGCAAAPPRQPATEHLDRDAIKAALKGEVHPAPPVSPGPPPFPQKILPRTVELDLPETLYSMTLNNVPLSAAIEAIMQDSQLNLSVESEVDLSRRVTVHLKQATFAEAMDMMVKNGAGYAWTVENEMLIINTFMERIYAFDYLDMPGKTDIQVGGDMLGSSVEESGVSGKYVMQTSKSEETTDVWLAIEKTLTTLKSEAGIVRLNRNGGLVYMADTPKQVTAMVRFLDAMSEALNRQVYIEAKIMEVRLTDKNELGIDWSALDLSFTSASGFFVDNFNMSFNGGSTLTLSNQSALNTVVDFLRTQGDVSVVSNPHLALMNGRSALLTVGFQFPYGDIDGVDRDDDTKVVTFGVSIKRAILGLQFGIAVQIAADGIVTMNIVPTITRIQEEEDVELPTSANTTQTIKNPIIDLQELSTTVRVREGNTVVLAGLISQVKNQQHKGVSGLGNLPLVGGWFKHVEDTVQTRELVIFITPHLRQGV
jgi:type II secretory pathway component GspD/PulD (secretin)